VRRAPWPSTGWRYPGPVFNERMNERMQELEREYEAVLAELNDPNLSSDPDRLREVSRATGARGGPVAELAAAAGAESDLEAAREMVRDSSGDERELAQAEVAQAEARHRPAGGGAPAPAGAEGSQRRPQRDHGDPWRRGRGGGQPLRQGPLRDVHPLRRRRGWKIEVLSSSPSERDGLNEITFVVKGDDAWQRLEHEGGPHRVQRVPVTESRGGSTPRRRRWPCCPRPRRSTWPSTPTTSRSTSTVRPARGGSRSTPPTRPCASPTCPPGSWWPCRTRRARSRTGPRP
jgi:hypothetical protein